MSQEFSEKPFFLQAFRGLTLTIALCEESDLTLHTQRALADVIRDLVIHQAKVLIVAQDETVVRAFLSGLESELSDLLPVLTSHGGEIPAALWNRVTPVHVVYLGGETAIEIFWERLARFGALLRLPRLLLIHRDGGEGWLDGEGESLNFVNPARLKRLLSDSDAGTSGRAVLRRTILELLTGGVGAVSLCRLSDLERELFSYEGRGLFFSRRHYCQVRRLTLDDFSAAAAMIRRGESEGFLLPRSDESVTALLTQGYGAFISEHHLSGVCGLVTGPYRSRNAGEITALYALTRFQGEGIGGRLLARMIQEARRMRLDLLFACVGDPRAMEFFGHHGFERVDSDRLPEEKWRHYDPARKARVVSLARRMGGGHDGDGATRG
ncbi:Amino-acid N-acetyltransferase [Candidatus Magnetaquicoccaceae bacterium FCR-1]|uniref:Amino-acid acetyltransferase n=1 Tax=Candidatus Magnetaquiglobus chichijimensis TaxID=3141448 RepID=A0ABQ0C9E2_9PROT